MKATPLQVQNTSMAFLTEDEAVPRAQSGPFHLDSSLAAPIAPEWAPAGMVCPEQPQSLKWVQVGDGWVADASVEMAVSRFGPPASWQYAFRVPLRLVVAPDPLYAAGTGRYPYVVALNPDSTFPGCCGSARVGCSSSVEGRRIAEDIYGLARLSLLQPISTTR